MPIFPTKTPEGEKWFSHIHGSEYHGGMTLIKSGYRLENGSRIPVGVATTFRVPVTQKQYDDLKSWYESSVGTSPYPYTQFGMRCASSVYRSLSRTGVISNNFPLNSATNAFGPGFLFRYLWNSGYQHTTNINLTGIDKKNVNFYNSNSIKKMAGL